MSLHPTEPISRGAPTLDRFSDPARYHLAPREYSSGQRAVLPLQPGYADRVILHRLWVEDACEARTGFVYR
jgi:hypothetical protein